MFKKILKILISSAIVISSAMTVMTAHAQFAVFQPIQGGTGAGGTLIGCIQGNGKSPFTSTGIACGSGGGGSTTPAGLSTDIQFNSNNKFDATSSLAFSSSTGNLTAPFFTAASTTATSTFAGPFLAANGNFGTPTTTNILPILAGSSTLGAGSNGSTENCVLTISGSTYIFVTKYYTGKLGIYKMTSPSSISSVVNVTVGTGPYGITCGLVGSTPYVWVTNFLSNSISAINVSSPSVFTTVTSTISTGQTDTIVYDHTTSNIYSADITDGALQIINYSTPTVPSILSTTAIAGGSVGGVAIDPTNPSLAYMLVASTTALNSSTLVIMNATNASSPSKLSTVGIGDCPYNATVLNGYLYSANYGGICNSTTALGNMSTVNVSSSTDPIFIGNLQLGETPTGIANNGSNAVYVSDQGDTAPTTGFLSTVSIANPAYPVLATTTAESVQPYGVYYFSPYLFVQNSGTDILNIYSLTGAFTSQYDVSTQNNTLSSNIPVHDYSSLVVDGDATLNANQTLAGSFSVSGSVSAASSLNVAGVSTLSGGVPSLNVGQDMSLGTGVLTFNSGDELTRLASISSISGNAGVLAILGDGSYNTVDGCSDGNQTINGINISGCSMYFQAGYDNVGSGGVEDGNFYINGGNYNPVGNVGGKTIIGNNQSGDIELYASTTLETNTTASHSVCTNSNNYLTTIGCSSGGSGTVTSVATDGTLTGGPITTTGTLGINLAANNAWTGTATSTFAGDFYVGTSSVTVANRARLVVQGGGGNIFNFLSQAGGSNLSLTNGGNVGIGSTTPGSLLSIATTSSAVSTASLFAISTSTNTTLFQVLGNGGTGIGTTTLSTNDVSIQNSAAATNIAGFYSSTGVLEDSFANTGASSFASGDLTINSAGSVQGAGGAVFTAASVNAVTLVIDGFSSTQVGNLFDVDTPGNISVLDAINNNGWLGIGSSTPGSQLSIMASSSLAGTNPIFTIASSSISHTGTTTLFSLSGDGTVNTVALVTTGNIQAGGDVRATAASCGGSAAFANSTSLNTGVCYINSTTTVIEDNAQSVASFILAGPGSSASTSPIMDVGTTTARLDTLYVQGGTSTAVSLGEFGIASSTGSKMIEVDSKGHMHVNNGGGVPSVACASTCTLDPNSSDGWGSIAISGVQTVVTLTMANSFNDMACMVGDNSTSGNYELTATSTTQATFSTAVSLGTANIWYNCVDLK